MIHAIFFDFNGVVIDDERIHLKAYRQILIEKDIPLTDEDYFASLGMDDTAFVQAAYARAGQSLSDEVMSLLIKREHELHREFINSDLPVPAGVVTFIKAAARHYQCDDAAEYSESVWRKGTSASYPLGLMRSPGYVASALAARVRPRKVPVPPPFVSSSA